MYVIRFGSLFCSAAAVLALIGAPPATAKTMRSNVSFNNGIGKKTANQPSDGVQVAYQIALKGGDLDGCTVDVVETLHPRENGAWGIFDIAGDTKCSGGAFSYTSSGAWDGKGFHAAGTITHGSGSFDGAKGRVAQLGGAVAPAANGTGDVSYQLVVD